ncbi:2-oxoacid:acceptor oxidoreductase family protein, partial [Candidatus Woesebacteria bacterium]|nr:2-oxoacid:acceptor oxidoreductase family protein [Candidatus Woesebacteria bacterium]
MHIQNRFVVKVSGASGQGINSVGETISKAIKETGLYSFGYREYPSLIKGGFASFQVDFSSAPLASSSDKCDMLLVLSVSAFSVYYSSVAKDGTIIHSVIGLQQSEEQQKYFSENNIKVVFVPAQQLVKEAGGHPLMVNTFLLGVLWQLLGLSFDHLIEVLKRTFAKKPEVIELNIKMLEAGKIFQNENLQPVTLGFEFHPEIVDEMIISGNQAIALGAVAAGVRAYYAYPMTPSSSILSYLAAISHETGMFVKQIEDEISVASLTVGSSFAGTRAMCGTSGGGFDLMTETVSLAAMTETPFVCVLAQRPGPATGLPTWTNAADLLLAAFAGHGEYPRVVLAASDPQSGYVLTQVAHNLADVYQIPVILLTEKQIAESHFQIKDLPPAIEIKRGLVAEDQLESLQKMDRYRSTENGVSLRWLPGQCAPTFDANSDEHLGDGSLTEDSV